MVDTIEHSLRAAEQSGRTVTLQIQIHGKYLHTLPNIERAKVADFYAARDSTIPPLPWSSIAPPITEAMCGFRTDPNPHSTPTLADFAFDERYAK